MQQSSIAIGELSSQSGVNIETIRYYERIGLIPQPPRTSGRRRVYAQSDVQRLAFIRRARELGFSIEDIRSLLSMSDTDRVCRDAYALALKHLDAVRASIRDLKRLERKLSAATKQCQQDAASRCAIIEALSHS